MPTIEFLSTQYPILTHLASYLSTLDLYHLGLASKHFHSHILASRPIFDTLKRTALCDGRGLKQRQNFEGPYRLRSVNGIWGGESKIWADEPIEVRLWALKCDEAGALPCRRCGVNVCEECRRYRREPGWTGYTSRRPHLNGAFQNENIFCLCDVCDTKLEQELHGKFLNELCDCDIPTRWMCGKCVDEEGKETRAMYAKHTISETEYYDTWDNLCEHTKSMTDHQFSILFVCHCGAYVPQAARPRCTWCNRRHRPESEWYDEMDEMRARPHTFEDPCYPPFVGDENGDNRGRPYPKLAYDGPIWRAPERANS